MQSVRQIEARAALIIADLIEEAANEAKENPENATDNPPKVIEAVKLFQKAGVLRNVGDWNVSYAYKGRRNDTLDPREVLVSLLDRALECY